MRKLEEETVRWWSLGAALRAICFVSLFSIWVIFCSITIEFIWSRLHSYSTYERDPISFFIRSKQHSYSIYSAFTSASCRVKELSNAKMCFLSGGWPPGTYPERACTCWEWV